MKRFISLFMTLAIVLSLSTSAFAAERVTASDAAEVHEAISLIENELAESNTCVIAELTAMKNRLSTFLSNTTDSAERVKISSQISQLEEMIAEYQSYQNGTLAVPYGSFHIVYSPAVAAVIAYFSQQGYTLSAELLTHARDNDVLDSSYTPTNTALVTQTTLYTELCGNGLTSGSDAFEKTGATVDDDLYYAIHGFSYTKDTTNNTLTITDRYDFAPNDWSDIQGVAVDMMYDAQEAGTIVPYQVIMTVAM